MFEVLNERQTVRRDELGVRPLYWAQWNGAVVISDDVNELFEQTKMPQTVRRELLGEYFAQGWICEPDTIWEGVYKVPAGCELVTEGGRPVVRRWWSVADRTAVDLPLRDCILESVVRAVQGGRKICNWFSGGIDSSILAAFVRDKGLKHLHMTLGDGESERVRMMEEKFGLDVERMKPDASLIRLYPELCKKMGEPIADPGVIAAYWLGHESVRRGCTAVLSGMGGDELDAGYPRNKIIVRLFNFDIVRAIGTWPLRIVGWLFLRGAFLLKGKRKRDVKRLGCFLLHPDVAHYFNLFGYFTKEEIDVIVGEGWFDRYCLKVAEQTTEFEGTKKFFGYEFKGFLASHNNIYGAQTCKAAGVECRTPLLTPKIAQQLWAEIDSPRFAGKKRLTQVLADELGDGFVKVRKSGFRFPVEERLGEVDWNEVRTRLQGLVTTEGLQLLDAVVHQARHGNVNEMYMKLWAFWTLANCLNV